MVNKKKILYIGGFEMPDKNAAAQRVLSIAKSLREAGYETFFYGMSKDAYAKGEVDGFKYDGYQYPHSTMTWFKYALGREILPYIQKVKPDFVFTYNYPAFAQEKVIHYCRKHGIKTVGDITEWYRTKSFVKKIDTWYRMHVSNKHLDGIIAISSYLNGFYKKQYTIQVPPFVDKSEEKWQIHVEKYQDDKVHLVYIGTGSIKDRLDKIIKGIYDAGADRFAVDIIGINEEKFHKIYTTDVDLAKMDITFHGRLPHKVAVEYLMKADFQIFFRDFVRVNNAGFPTKFVESMSAGVPVITNRISNIADYIVNGKNSFMIEHPEDSEICEVLVRVSKLSREEINAIKKNCLVDDFDYHKYTDSLKSFMEGL